jgi:putative transposase
MRHSGIRKLPFSVDGLQVDFSGRMICQGGSDEEVEVQRITDCGDLEGGGTRVPVAQVLRQHGISQATYYSWKAKYGGASLAELKRLRELEAENSKLKRMYADLALENAAIKDVLSRKL